jgi:hypothetical protein
MEVLGMENIGIFYAHFEYNISIRNSLWSFGNFMEIFPFWYVVPRKIWQP